MSQPSITCPRCGRTSWNENDVRERYCGACHQFHDFMGGDLSMLFHDAKNAKPITELWAWVSVDEDGNEGIIAAPIVPGMGTTPLVFSKRELTMRFESHARDATRLFGKTARLVHFTRKADA